MAKTDDVSMTSSVSQRRVENANAHLSIQIKGPGIVTEICPISEYCLGHFKKKHKIESQHICRNQISLAVLTDSCNDCCHIVNYIVLSKSHLKKSELASSVKHI